MNPNFTPPNQPAKEYYFRQAAEAMIEIEDNPDNEEAINKRKHALGRLGMLRCDE